MEIRGKLLISDKNNCTFVAGAGAWARVSPSIHVNRQIQKHKLQSVNTFPHARLDVAFHGTCGHQPLLFQSVRAKTIFLNMSHLTGRYSIRRAKLLQTGQNVHLPALTV